MKTPTPTLTNFDNATLDLCVDYIQLRQCILFLGPNFAIDSNGVKINELIQKSLQASNFANRLDFSYDNLYLFKESKPRAADKMKLNLELKKVYKSVEKHSLYDKIAAIPFSAIISCSPDDLIRKAHDEGEYDLNFQFYSRKGANAYLTKEDPEATYLYNVFGYYDNEDSLINTYAGFFKFIISILGDEQKLPLELRNRIAEARIFILMGFDLTKWYMPLLVHKIHSFKQEGNETTAMINKDNKVDDETEKFLPVESIVLDHNSEPVIDALYGKLALTNQLKKTKKTSKYSVKTDLNKLVAQNDLGEAIRQIRSQYNDKGIDVRDIDLIEGRFENLKQNIRLTLISDGAAGLERSKIASGILDLIDTLSDNS